jgi:hypothetical protein
MTDVAVILTPDVLTCHLIPKMWWGRGSRGGQVNQQCHLLNLDDGPPPPLVRPRRVFGGAGVQRYGWLPGTRHSQLRRSSLGSRFSVLVHWLEIAGLSHL